MSKVLQELHNIREKIYEKEKNLSKETVRYNRQQILEQFMKKHKIKLNRLEKSL
ncbi:MAG: hypothetical protein SNJ64_03420 [Endomicrobiia bacterium]